MDGLLYNEKQTIALKNILILFAVFFFSSVHAQYEWTPAKVILKNGQSFRGLVKFPKHSGGLISIGSTEFKYKKNKKGTTKKYGSESVDEVIFGDAYFATVHYKYVPIKDLASCLAFEVLFEPLPEEAPAPQVAITQAICFVLLILLVSESSLTSL